MRPTRCSIWHACRKVICLANPPNSPSASRRCSTCHCEKSSDEAISGPIASSLLNLRLHHHLSMHERVQPAHVVKSPCLVEHVAERPVRIHRRRLELQRREHHAVRHVVLVCPSYCHAHLHCQRCRRERKIVDDHLRIRRLGPIITASDQHQRCDADRTAQQQTPGNTARLRNLRHVSAPQPARGVSTIARGAFDDTRLTLAMPRYSFSSPAGTTIGPGLFAVPGAGCGNAVARAVWNATEPSTFCITWWMCPFSTVTDPNFFR